MTPEERETVQMEVTKEAMEALIALLTKRDKRIAEYQKQTDEMAASIERLADSGTEKELKIREQAQRIVELNRENLILKAENLILKAVERLKKENEG